jgi:adenosine kinase
LDITVTSTAEYLGTFGLTQGTAILAAPQHLPIYGDSEARPDVQYCAGGSSMNTTRALQWMLQEPGATAFVGCIGADKSADTLRAAVVDAGVAPHFLVNAEHPTGKCAVLITDKERTLITHLGAAEQYQLAHLQTTPAVQDAMASARVYYAEGFFATVSTDALVALGERAEREDKLFMFNLSAPFLVQVPAFWANMQRVFPYVTHLFCNETEAAALAARMGWPEAAAADLRELAKLMVAMPCKRSSGRTVVITHGAEDTVMCHRGKITTLRPPLCPREQIVDTNGAGDCFVGGFIAGVLRNLAPERCVEAGQYCSWMCLHQVGCRFVGKPTFSF